MTEELKAAPVLSTPDARILEESEPVANTRPAGENVSDDDFRITYDIERTIREIRQGKWRRIALQFPDDMLPDAPRVFQLLSRGLDSHVLDNKDEECKRTTNGPEGAEDAATAGLATSLDRRLDLNEAPLLPAPKLYILADTSYGTCCVDEVAAEHVDADVVVHYGRSCLSPTARLPVIYVFTCRPLDYETVVRAFEESYPDLDERVAIAADVTYTAHIDAIASILTQEKGYKNIFATQVVHNPSSPIPNRTIPPSVESGEETLNGWQLFHISDPPTSLLLTLSSRVAAIQIFPTGQMASHPGSGGKALVASTGTSLRRRYAILTSLNTAPIFGILVNTLSVKNYLHIVQHVQKLISAAGKKSYLFVVGKLNVAKIANFSEIEGWVIIGCWESSLVDSRDFWRPVITPYELELALQSDDERVWTGAWSSDYQPLLHTDKPSTSISKAEHEAATTASTGMGDEKGEEEEEEDLSESESAPPEFDLRTGRYISRSTTRPMKASPRTAASQSPDEPEGRHTNSLARRFNSDVATIGGVVSPGAEFLKSSRSWRGLGSDFVVEYEEDNDGPRGSLMVEGLAGIARGYSTGDNQERR